MRLVSRGDTTVADAYLSPVLRRYVQRVAAALPGMRLQFMQSNGGLSDAASFHGKDAILSGPAGGIVGAARAAASAGIDKIIAFDMGGTSTDVGHFAGEFERALDVEVGGVRLRTPILRIHTVAAGGGSIVNFDGVRLRVGPESAGANPGPACYRRGGPLTVTDCNVLLGRIQPDFFPAMFGATGQQPLDADIVTQQVRRAFAASIPARNWHAGHGRARRRLHSHRGREHGQCHQEDLRAARARCHRVHVDLLWRRGGPARLPGGRCAGNAARVHSSAGRSALRLWHRAGGLRSPCGSGPSKSIWTMTRWRSSRRPSHSSRSEARAELAGQGYAGHRRSNARCCSSMPTRIPR